MLTPEQNYPRVMSKARFDLLSTVCRAGQLLFAVAIVSIGLGHMVTGNFPVALLPFPADFPGRAALVLTVGIALIIAGLAIGLLRKARPAALGLGLLFLLFVLYPHVPKLIANMYNGGAWTVLSELVALSGGAFYAAGLLSKPLVATLHSGFNWQSVGRVLIAVSLLIFGVQHFIYARYIATLIPSWIPAPLFWAYFVGVAFVATAISLLLKRQRSLSGGLLGIMFLLWVMLLHAPRVVLHSELEPEWTSLWIALAMSGIGFMIAGSERQTKDDKH